MANNTIYQSNNRGVDTEPTTDSNNLITSGAVKAAMPYYYDVELTTDGSGISTIPNGDSSKVITVNVLVDWVCCSVISNYASATAGIVVTDRSTGQAIPNFTANFRIWMVG